jgi:RNA polymerase sigma-70 factor (ECF subfamily)
LTVPKFTGVRSSSVPLIGGTLFERAYRTAEAARWALPPERLHEALDAGIVRAFQDRTPTDRELKRYLDSLHLPDLALACACADGDERAWDHFILHHRSVLYRAADALDPTGGARDLADSLYAELFGVRGGTEARRASLFRYYHGRSSLSTWLRAVLSQRYVDRVRAERRTTALDDERAAAIPAPEMEPERLRYAALVGRALQSAIGRLDAKDRLRLRAYYEQDLTLSQVGRLTGEHEATVSRQLAKTRKLLRADVEQQMRAESGLSEAEIARCVAVVTEDAGPLDLRELFGSGAQDSSGRSF